MENESALDGEQDLPQLILEPRHVDQRYSAITNTSEDLLQVLIALGQDLLFLGSYIAGN